MAASDSAGTGNGDTDIDRDELTDLQRRVFDALDDQGDTATREGTGVAGSGLSGSDHSRGPDGGTTGGTAVGGGPGLTTDGRS